MSLNAPCLNCPNKIIGCHSTCDLYIAFQKENNKKIEERKKYNEIKCMWYDLKKEKYKRLNNKRR